MGFLKDVSGWLSGGGGRGRKDNMRQASIKLRVFNKRLMRQVKKLEISASQARNKAVQLRKEGDIEGSKFHARNYLQVKNQARAVDIFKSNIENLLYRLDNAQAMKDVSEVLKGVASSVAGLKQSFSVPQLSEMMKDIQMDVEDFEVAEEITSESMTDMNLDTAVTDDKVNMFLGEIDAEIGIETGIALPSAGSNSQKIKELEEELNRLKSQE